MHYLKITGNGNSNDMFKGKENTNGNGNDYVGNETVTERSLQKYIKI